ncbi:MULTISPECIES: TVP38/TMEM64 family protein [unclassified Bacillus (in: firmicutes)]|uniref:TVP38/TMEM64 family protein n=1 Tax=unclassified Bacillus (in: firmicutes) TaxID=185979 RepID=UPI0008F1507C|nr:MULTISPECIES: VTT domain-containing protein [unclassified Bacillus (in: firmicutes)]SFB11971.1 Uncharacterized membrane protein YdjX, TVP38/TMEM64 family, SNARE-associated domain [Bacillus sp. UNCCL13]SFQ90372.1 Uncharacterized membrane protein YdjX, TVP38/TMEM64 family, SNARE-associated domain [Bacillus sp. cl95]
MQSEVIEFFIAYPQYAILFSLVISIIISIAGVIPSVFLTAANLIVFGFWEGMLLSVLGESLGAYVSFILYRKGLRKFALQKSVNHKYLQRLLKTEGRDAFFLIIGLRIFPFMPSGLVTLTAAVSNVSAVIFVIASSIGKVPALFIEAYSVYQVIQWNGSGKMFLMIASIIILIYILRKIFFKDTDLYS